MKCEDPVLIGDGVYRCARCIPCRRFKAREWQLRILLERLDHAACSFVTVTYDDEHLPVDGLVSVEVAQKWLKRLRKHLGVKVRYFVVGEYGDLSRRPHYHAALFGVGCGRDFRFDVATRRLGCDCEFHSALRKSWTMGHVHVGDLSEASARYLANYVVKGRTGPDVRLREFSRMSRMPGLGVNAVLDIAISALLARRTDVPGYLRFGRTVFPMARLLRQQIVKASDGELSSRGLVPSQAVRLLRQFAECNSITVREAWGMVHSPSSTAYEARRVKRETI